MIPTNNPYCKRRAELMRELEKAEPGSSKHKQVQEHLLKTTSLCDSYLINFNKKEVGALAWKSQRLLNAFNECSN
jgi:hypothetical protein